MTQRETLLAAAASLPATFSDVQLLLAAWELDRQGFGLPGCHDAHPDARKVQNALYGKPGLLAKGLVAKAGTMFRVTSVGQAVLRLVRRDGPAPVTMTEALAMPEPNDQRLRQAQLSRAYRLYMLGAKAGITYPDATEFWGGGADCAEAFGALVRGRGTEELRGLACCHEWLLARFERHLALAGARR